MLGEDPEMRELDELSLIQWSDLYIDEQKRLEVFPLWVVSELFDAPRDFNELGLERFQLPAVVLRVLPFARRNRRKV